MKKVFGLLGLGLISSLATAAPVTISSYDIESTYVSGTGGWKHDYTGTITPVSGDIANYSGGSGTLNDGVVGTHVLNTQLFNYPYDSSPVITLYFDDYYSLDSLLISGGDFIQNTIVGSLFALDVTIGSTTESFQTTEQGQTDGTRYADDFVSFAGSSLEGLVTNQLTLSGFDSSWTINSANAFSITEITLDGSAISSSVSEPGTLALFSLGLAGLVFSRKKKLA